MKFRSLSAPHAIIALALLLVGSPLAQEGQGPFPPSVTDPLFYKVKDPELHAALTTLHSQARKLREASLQPPKVRFQTEANIFNEPANLKAISVVLAAAETSGLDVYPESVQHFIEGAISAALISGSSVHVPSLKRLAFSADKRLRDFVASDNAIGESPTPPLEVLKACLQSNEEHLPATLQGLQEGTPSYREVGRQLDDFHDLVRKFARLAKPEQRQEIAPIVERFLARYDDPKFQEVFATRLRRYLKEGTEKMDFEDSQPSVNPNEKESPMPESKPAATKSD